MDRLARDLAGRLYVVRLSVFSTAGQALGDRWDARVTPTFILFDGAGRETWRGVGAPDVAAIREALGLP